MRLVFLAMFFLACGAAGLNETKKVVSVIDVVDDQACTDIGAVTDNGTVKIVCVLVDEVEKIIEHLNAIHPDGGVNQCTTIRARGKSACGSNDELLKELDTIDKTRAEMIRR